MASQTGLQVSRAADAETPRTLAELDPADSAFLGDLMSVVQSLVKEYKLEQGGYRLVVNGGEYQDFPHLHFHLISDVPRSAKSPDFA